MAEKKGWDARTWLVGIVGGAVGGNVMAWSIYPPAVKHINAAVHSGNAAGWVFGLSFFFSLLVLPGVVSGIARRRTFLWGFLPLALSFAAVELEDWADNGPHHVAQEFWVSLFAFTCCLLVSSGPVSLFRHGRVRARRKQENAAASLIAQREAASVAHEGVWPPPPDYRK